MKQAIIGILIVVAVVGGAYLYFKKSFEPAAAPENSSGQSSQQNLPGNLGGGTQNAPAASSVPNVREFIVEGRNFSLTPAAITVKKGDTVKITFKNTGGTHDFTIDEFGVKTMRISGGAEESVQFIADRTGSFEYYCSVGIHRQTGMKGTLIVEK